MAVGDLKYEGGQWWIERLTPSKLDFGKTEWVTLASVDAELAKNLAGYDAVRSGDDDSETYHNRATGEWDSGEVALGIVPPKPQSWPKERPYPPLDKDGEPQWPVIQQYQDRDEREANEAQAEKEKASKEAASRQPPAFWTNPDTGERYRKTTEGWTPDKTPEQEIAQTPRTPTSVEALITQALAQGNIDKALAYDALRDRPTHQQSLQFAMQYAESEDEFWSLYALSQGFIAPAPFAMQGFTIPGPNYAQGVSQGFITPFAGQPSPSQQAGFEPGSYTARSFDAQDPATQQQYLLGQQYKKAGGLLPSDIKTQPILGAPGTGQGIANPFQFQSAQSEIAAAQPQGFLRPGDASIVAADQAERAQFPPFQPSSATEEMNGGLLGASPFLQGQKERYDFLAGFPAGTPKSRESDPYKFTSDAALEQIIGSYEVSDEERAAAQAEADRRKNVGAQQVETFNTKGLDASFADFMAGSPDLGDVTGPERALALASSPYAGKVMASNPVTGQWTDWIDPRSGERFQENRATDPNKSGLSSTGLFEPVQKPQQPQGFMRPNLSSIFDRRKKKEPRRINSQPILVRPR